jgi:hypothetical protein
MIKTFIRQEYIVVVKCDFFFFYSIFFKQSGVGKVFEM